MQASPYAVLDEANAPHKRTAGNKLVARWLQWQALVDELMPLLLAPYDCPGFLARITDCAATVMSLMQEDPDTGIFHMVHPTPDKMRRYSVVHAMHTALLLALVGQRKDWGDKRTASAVKAGLTMNLSITNLQIDLAQQNTPLTPEQREEITAHPLSSVKLLQDLGVQDDEWLIAVAQHHEQADGKGYPQGLTRLHQLADAIRTCDVFGAKISPRVGRTGMPTPRAASEIFRQRSAGYFGATIIRELGLYPPGCLVELATGHQAVVVKRSCAPHEPEVVTLPAFERCIATQASGRHIIGAASDQSWAERISPLQILARV
jgi:hypothetical protein